MRDEKKKTPSGEDVLGGKTICAQEDCDIVKLYKKNIRNKIK
jgi:hypothetical protein